MSERLSPLASQPTAADESAPRSRRKVRMFSPDSSSDDDQVVDGHPSVEDGHPGHLRSMSYPGSGAHTGLTRNSSISGGPKLNRSATYGRSSAASSGGNSAHQPSAGPSRRLRSDNRIHHTRTGSLRSRKLEAAFSRLDVNDADSYFRGGDEWKSDDDDDDFDLIDGSYAKTVAAEAARMATECDRLTPDAHSLSQMMDLANNGVGQPKSVILTSPPPEAFFETDEGRERLEWQSMLASVLGGDILRGESSRIGVERPSSETYRKTIGESLWWQIRAKLRNRTKEEERRRVEQRRHRVVDVVLEEIADFSVKSDSSLTALEQVSYILQKLSIVESLYPHQRAFRLDKPLYDSEAFQNRIDALSAWSSVVTQLQAILTILQKWTGTEDLDITRPNTTKEKALVGSSDTGYHPLDTKARAHANAHAADNSTFVDRVLKEDSLRRMFEKRIFLDLLAVIQNAKQTVVAHSPMFAELNLPDFQYELVRCISFPGRLIIEALKTRLRASERLVDPNIMVVDDMADSFRSSIALCIIIRRQYEEIVAPDPDNRWKIPDSFPAEHREVLLKCIKMFFKLLHWKLKSGSRAVYFRDTDILEEEWEFLYDASEAVEGVDLVVAESLCSLTSKLMGRVINYFESSLHVPIPLDEAPGSLSKQVTTTSDGRQRERQPMSSAQMVVWFGKILDAIKMRYRKLQRFARRLTQRFDNSAEYGFEDTDSELLIQRLHDSGHFLVYTHKYEEQGTYIFADGSLWDQPSDVRQLLFRAFAVNLTGPGSMPHGRRMEARDDMYSDDEDEEDVSDDAQYLLLVSPRQSFAWTGAVMNLDVAQNIDFALEDNRIRLIADGPMIRLTYCKMLFLRSVTDPEIPGPIIQPKVLVEQQAHLPKVNRELKKIARSAHRLSECIIESAAHVRRTLRGEPGTQDLIENWYLFASDHGHRVAVHMDHMAWARFSRLLMRLAISWVSFICDNCDPTDRKTFRWTVNALEYAMLMTRGNNILHLTKEEFALLRSKVASCMTLLISHFDILGARSGIEAKKEAERLKALRRMASLFDRPEEDDALVTRSPSVKSMSNMQSQADRSLRIPRDDRLRVISDLDTRIATLSSDQHLIGRVLDEEVSEDRALVFLAASSSNISLRWQQGGFIGGGANGSVYLGFNLDSGGIMAVKEIRVQDITNSPALYKQIKDEADVMQMLSHPNIVDYYGIEVHRDRVYIFEEYCPGGSLANLLEHGRVEDEEVIMVYAWQMLQGLQYLHSKGVEHRDVKPDNILLGTNSVLKFVDFGAAKVIIKGHRTMAKTRAMNRGNNDAAPAVMNSLAGTPMYLAPEVIKGGSGRLGAADIWSMGCCVLEVTTGHKPWSNLDNEWAIMFHIGIATQHPPLPDPSQMSDLGIDFIAQCLSLEPDERPTATELLNHPWLAPMVEFSMPESSPTAYTTGIDSPVEPSLPSMSDSSSTPSYSPWSGSGSYVVSPLSETTLPLSMTEMASDAGTDVGTLTPGTPDMQVPPVPVKSPLRAMQVEQVEHVEQVDHVEQQPIGDVSEVA